MRVSDDGCHWSAVLRRPVLLDEEKTLGGEYADQWHPRPHALAIHASSKIAISKSLVIGVTAR